MQDDVLREVSEFIEEGTEEVVEAMKLAGEAAVAWNIANGDYQDRTGNLRASNYYEVAEDGLIVGNSADYAGYVESKGYMVCSEGALLAEKILNGD